MAHSRRDFLLRTGCGTLSTAAFFTGFNRFSLMNLFAAQAQTNDDYKALVCVFMFGGNDSNNLIIPYDDYALYSAARAGSQFEIPQADLLQITPRSLGGAVYGLPNRTTYDTTGWKALWDAGVLGFVVN